VRLDDEAFWQYLKAWDLPTLPAGGEPPAHVEHVVCLRLGIDWDSAQPTLSLSSHGQELARITVVPSIGLRDYQARDLALSGNVPREYLAEFSRIARRLYESAAASDLTFIEFDPLLLVPDGTLLIMDGNITIDDSALFRQPRWTAQSASSQPSVQNSGARMTYVPLKGHIGCLANGAGLALATMDVIAHYGGAIQAANFLDVGDSLTASDLTAGLRLISSQPGVRVLLLNLFAGNRCRETAHRVYEAMQAVASPLPTVVLLDGSDASDGRALLEASTLPQLMVVSTLREAARRAAHVGAD
jgi:succinyl-CoA synthetase beta subunit